ncbi:MAG: M28 family peptidase [Cyanobacteria bacterium P01_D01_bin.128]
MLPRFRHRLGWISISAIAFLICIAIAVAPQRSSAPASQKLSLTATAAIASPAALAQAQPMVSRDRLLTHLNALAFPRFNAQERDRARQYIIDTLTRLGWDIRLEPFPSGINIIAEQPGSTGESILILGAHYDTVQNSPGADDNASALAVLLETARLFANADPAASLRLVFLDQEEQGLVGSRFYAGQPANLAGVRGAIILDMVGYTCSQPGCQTYPPGLPITPPSDRGDFIGIVSDSLELLSAFETVNSERSPPAFLLPISLSDENIPLDLLRSDHVPFWQQGISAVLITDTANFRNPHYHQPTDTVETLNLEFLTAVGQKCVSAIEEISQ